MKHVPPRKIKLMMTIILLVTGTGGLIMGSVLDESLIILLGSVNLAFASFIGIRYIQSKSQKEK
ncbi:MAG TPA: hypothetical protein VJJ25_02425 [Nitrosopumilaceae archaeon]|nr:hypothetical protein [Nitrosopumilaceae archaeon]